MKDEAKALRTRKRVNDIFWEAMCDIMPLDTPFTVEELAGRFYQFRHEIRVCLATVQNEKRIRQFLEDVLPTAEPGHLEYLGHGQWVLPSAKGE